MAVNHMEKQATINIGTIGHVAHGKSTIVQCISGTSTIKYKAELEKNITIKLGYANAKIYSCECDRPSCYSTKPGKCSKCNKERILVRHVSFVDCPGHDILMATMLNGTAVMDSALLLIAANEPCPQPQTIEHLFAVEVMDLTNVLVIQNKIDLVSREQAIEQHSQIKQFLKTSSIKSPVVPVSGQFNINIDAILDFIVNYIEVPVRDLESSARMVIIRSFDINRPGTSVEKMHGGVIGGSLISGVLKVGEEIEVRPGLVVKRAGGFVCMPFVSKILSLKADTTPLEEAIPGGLIGVGTSLDPHFCKSDRLVGMVMGPKGTLPPIYYKIKVTYELFQKTVNVVKQEIVVGEQLLLNIGSSTVGCKVTSLGSKIVTFDMIRPCCCEIGDRIAISRKVKNNWRLIGFGTINDGTLAEVTYENPNNN